jgi:hypothetical protein
MVPLIKLVYQIELEDLFLNLILDPSNPSLLILNKTSKK